VLSYRAGSVAAVAGFVGVAFLFGGATLLVSAAQVPGMRWVFLVVGILAVVAGIMTFAWPDVTVYVVSVFVAWYFIIFGVVHLLGALAGPKLGWWWTQLLLGAAELILGVWALRSWERSVLTLLTLVGIWAIVHGVSQIFGAFALKEIGKQAERALS
jgi:uncharacterized membrane protein HdeD (DUF308 family)